MFARRALVRVTVIVLCGALGAGLVSCSAYSVVAEGDNLDSPDLESGDRIRIHLVDGSVIDDTFVRMRNNELECMRHTVDLASVASIEQHQSLVVHLLLVFGGMATLIVVSIISYGWDK